MSTPVREGDARSKRSDAGLGARVVGILERLLATSPRVMAFAAGAVSTLAMAPVFAWPVLFVTFLVLVRLLDQTHRQCATGRSRALGAFAVGWMFGFGYFLVGLYWISASLFVEPDKFLWLLPFSASLIPAGLAVFFGLAAMAAIGLWRPGVARVMALALTLTVAEWLRGHVFTGLPWNLLGYALTAPPLLMQTVAVTGTYALTFVAVLVFALPSLALDPEAEAWTRRWCVVVPVLALCSMAGIGAYRWWRPLPPDMAGVRLRLVQPNISQDMKWRHENRERIFRDYLDRSRRNPAGQDDGLAGITHVVWPESAIPFLLLNSETALEAVADLLPDGTHLLTGAIRLEQPLPTAGAAPRRKVFNSILALDDRARLVALYDKLHLVPFGEYLPFQQTLEALGLHQMVPMPGGFAAGVEPVRHVVVPGLPPMSPLICYESIFPDEVVTRGRRPGFFLNVTNDGWFGRTAGPHQHLHQARVRAVEHGLPLIRVANTGISAVIDAQGRILQRAGLDRAAVIDTGLPAAGKPTIYSRTGDWILVLLLLAGAAGWWLAGERPKSGR